MRILVDTAIWYQFSRGLPLPRELEAALKDSQNDVFICAISSMEIGRKWKTGKLPCPDPTLWMDEALKGFEVLPISERIARQAALWDWEHRDPSDRLIAATACVHGIELWHYDTVLKGLKGFPQRYFKAPAIFKSAILAIQSG